VQGHAQLHDVETAAGVRFEDAHEATIGGYVLERLGRLPSVGDRVELEGVVVEIVAVDEARIVELRLARAGA
jgi:putative hemolysin